MGDPRKFHSWCATSYWLTGPKKSISGTQRIGGVCVSAWPYTPSEPQVDSWQRPSVQPHAFFVSLVEHSLAFLPAPTETVPGRALSHASDELTVQSCRLGTLRTESILTSNFFTLVCKKRKPLSCRVAGPGCVMILESQMLFLAECQGQTIQGTLVKEK